MLSHGIVNASHVAGLLSLIDGVTNAIDVQVAKNNGDLEQEIVIISQLHVINVQQIRDLDCLAVCREGGYNRHFAQFAKRNANLF
jgi:hypothetical protein